jgi:hypothetical protein
MFVLYVQLLVSIGHENEPYVFWALCPSLPWSNLFFNTGCFDIWSLVYLQALIQLQQGMYVAIYIYINGCVCSNITLERLEQFQPNLVHI